MDTLFSHDARKSIDELVVSPAQRIVTDYWIIIDGHRFDAVDVRDTLHETCSGLSDSYMTDRRMVEALKKLGVIEHGGSDRWCMSAAKGPNYDYFMNWLDAEIERIATETRRYNPSAETDV